MEQPPSIIQHGAQSQANVNTGNGTIVVNNNYQQINTLSEVSKYLRSWYSFVYKEKHIERAETEKLWNWITRWEDVKNPMDRVSMLVGDAGSGKSVVMHDLLLRLENEGIKTLGLKSDLLFASESDLDRAVGLGQSVSSVLSEIANAEKVVLLVDQIDALSSTLSSNRKPLQSVNSLVAEVCQCANARIVVSCRPYDQQYDPSLDRYSNRNVVTMGELSSDDVDSTLALVGIQIENDELLVKKFLANPLNLYLFCKVSNGGVFAGRRPNRTILYEALWKQIVNDKSQETDLVDVKGLTSCLDMVSTKMYERLVLAIPSKQIETLYPYELTFLVSNGLFVSEPTSSQVQFMHQSLYDYVYARLFYSKGLSIDNILSGVHQGLFIRLRLKQILFYLRDIDEDAYLQNFSELLFAADRDGKGKYRFHLKHLMLSNLGFLTDLTAKEKYFVEKKILANQSYADIYIDSINTWVGLDLYTSYVNRYGGISSLKDEKQIQLINACERVLYTNPHNTISYLNSIDFVGLSTESKKAIQRVANRMPVEDATVEQILLLIKKLEDEESALTLEHLLVSLIPYCPDYVGNKLVEYVKHIVDAIEGGFSSHDINIGYELDYILDELKDKEPKVAFEVTIKLVEYLGRKSVLEVQNDITIKTSRVFYLYHRHDDFGSFTDKLLSYVLDSAEKYAQNDDVDFRERLRSYADSDLAVMVVIATCAYTKNINGYVKEAFNLSKRLLASEFTSSLLDYNAKELFKVMFPLLSREDKDEIMATLGRLSPKWEITLAKDKKNDRGYSYIGYTRAHYYGMLSEEDIAFYPEALKFRDEKLRVFKTLENHEPFKTSFMSGWRTLSPDWYQSFTVPELVKTMQEITNDFNHNWEAPTKTGHAMAIRQQIPNRADDVYEAYMKALDDPELDQDYPIYGIEAFIEMSYNKDLIDALVCKILSTYSKRLDELAASHVIQTCRIVDKYYDKNLTIPDQLFEFVCRIAMEWDDSEYKTEEGSKQSYTEGINQVRGCAAETLLRCYDEPNRYDRIFAALQCVAENGAVSTRAAVLFRFGAFMKAGHDRCLKLFLDMTSDYATSLLKLPVHNLNPLLYLMNDYFDELKPYFEECIKNKETHLVNTYLLWIAWVRKLDGAEKMMYRMADSSIEGRASLIKEIDGHYIQHLNSIIPVLYRYVNYDEQETASAYDIYFNRNIQHWPNEIRLPFVDEFVRSAACKYCSHYFMEFLQYYATIDPISTLKWLPMVYERKGSENSWACSPSKLIDILLLAYNSIVKFDRNDPTLEDALDLLDVWLHNNDNRQYLYNCFKLLEE